jgi:hypothetical protein
VTRPSSPHVFPDGPPAPDDEELALEVDALIHQLGVDAAEIEVEAVEPVQVGDPAPHPEPEHDEFEVDVDAIWSKDRAIDPEVHEAEIALVEAHAKAKAAAEVAQVKAQAAAERLAELERLVQEATTRRET